MKKIFELRIFLLALIIVIMWCYISTNLFFNNDNIVIISTCSLTIVVVLIMSAVMPKKRCYIKHLYDNYYSVLLPYDFLLLRCHMVNGECNVVEGRPFDLHDLFDCKNSNEISKYEFGESIFLSTKSYLSQRGLKKWGALHFTFIFLL